MANPCIHELLKAFNALDDAWQVELENTFGARAGDMRYEEGGMGAAGTPLAEVYALRMATFRAWENAKIRANNLRSAA